MITAVDSSVLLDVLSGDSQHGPRSAAALRQVAADGALVASTVVWAEVIGAYDQPSAVTDGSTAWGSSLFLTTATSRSMPVGCIAPIGRAAGRAGASCLTS